ncbi:MAG: preprotein translocase subunit SecG [Candidatus Wildermuthbacteria bacterium GWA2_46_15]|jgi:protein translocase SecG subunit|uniref:Protein-export membrane protein SecG n=1 Tax=Candidatus Wildermuthbacteria bacterium GWA2_46_15 TaxID=1802443 RepID=A0A1G2QQK8_9BACT|nr:preprotein translocase subunit SecG [bacterium]OHA62171.1 MAG: preprotein translocase subunit SecG [Candidatus Wildermuthbacteria bacterium GWA2_46_15]
MNLQNLVAALSQIKPFLPVIQIVIAVLLTSLVLLQPRGESLGSAFGQSFTGTGKLRGISKKIFFFTIFLGFIFIATALLNLLL